MAGAWKGQNGPRILTEAQRERKREKDRITKREEKLKTQQKIQDLEKSNCLSARRIKELEAQVRTLLDTCRCTGRSGTPGCTSCQETYHQRPTLSAFYQGHEVVMAPVSDTTSVYGRYVEEGFATFSDFCSVGSSMSVDTKTFSNTHQSHQSHNMSDSSPISETYSPSMLTPNGINDPGLEAHELGYTSLPYRTQREPNGVQNDCFPRLKPKVPQFLEANSLELKNMINGLDSLAKSYKGNPNIIEDNNITYDFCIRALLEGWDEAWKSYQGPLCPLWPILQWLDEFILKVLPFSVRLAYLRQTHSLFLVS